MKWFAELPASHPLPHPSPFHSHCSWCVQVVLGSRVYANYNTGYCCANNNLVDHELFIFGQGKRENSVRGRGNSNAHNSAVTSFPAPTSEGKGTHRHFLTACVRGGGERQRSGREKRVGLWSKAKLFMFKFLTNAVPHARKVSIALTSLRRLTLWLEMSSLILDSWSNLGEENVTVFKHLAVTFICTINMLLSIAGSGCHQECSSKQVWRLNFYNL